VNRCHGIFQHFMSPKVAHSGERGSHILFPNINEYYQH
jgi:hypothetical protein